MVSRLAAIRETQNLSRQALADRAGFTAEAIRKLEAGTNMPNLTTAYAVARALGVTVEEIWPVPEMEESQHA